MKKLAKDCYRNKDFNKAITIYKTLLGKQIEFLGEYNDDTLTTLHELGISCIEINNYDGAIFYLHDLLRKYISLFGEDNFAVITTKLNIANCFGNKKKYNEAIQYFEEVVVKLSNTLGPTHIFTLRTMHYYTMCYIRMENFDDVIPMQEKLVEDLINRCNQLGAKDKYAMVSVENLAIAYMGKARYNEALPLLENLLEIETSTLGPDDKYTLATKSQLDKCKNIMGNTTS